MHKLVPILNIRGITIDWNSFQKTRILFLLVYLMSSSMVRMNMNVKKRPAPPRKCQMSCLISKAL